MNVPVTNGSLVVATPANARRDPLTPNGSHNVGKWEEWERIRFLQGLRRYGRGKWSKIGEGIPTRTTIQVKTHAQVVLGRMDKGENVFAELDHLVSLEARTCIDKTAVSDNILSPTVSNLNLNSEEVDAANTLFNMRKCD
jgi:SHAQKYF class myb-like DNA-binding protein